MAKRRSTARGLITCGHDGRLDGGGAPLRVDRAEEADDAGDVRARHGRAGLRVEGHAPRVEGEVRGRVGARPRGDHAHSGRRDVGLQQQHMRKKTSVMPAAAAAGDRASFKDGSRSVKNLEDLWSDGVGPLRREGGHERRRLRSKDSRWLSDEAGRIPGRLT